MKLQWSTCVRCLAVEAMYALALGLVILLWVMSDSNHWAGGFRPLHVRLMIALWQAFGPFAFVATYPSHPVLIFCVIWSCWLLFVFMSPLRNWPLVLHFVLAMLWCASGFPAASLVIT